MKEAGRCAGREGRSDPRSRPVQAPLLGGVGGWRGAGGGGSATPCPAPSPPRAQVTPPASLPPTPDPRPACAQAAPPPSLQLLLRAPGLGAEGGAGDPGAERDALPPTPALREFQQKSPPEDPRRGREAPRAASTCPHILSSSPGLAPVPGRWQSGPRAGSENSGRSQAREGRALGKASGVPATWGVGIEVFPCFRARMFHWLAQPRSGCWGDRGTSEQNLVLVGTNRQNVRGGRGHSRWGSCMGGREGPTSRNLPQVRGSPCHQGADPGPEGPTAGTGLPACTRRSERWRPNPVRRQGAGSPRSWGAPWRRGAYFPSPSSPPPTFPVETLFRPPCLSPL